MFKLLITTVTFTERDQSASSIVELFETEADRRLAEERLIRANEGLSSTSSLRQWPHRFQYVELN